MRQGFRHTVKLRKLIFSISHARRGVFSTVFSRVYPFYRGNVMFPWTCQTVSPSSKLDFQTWHFCVSIKCKHRSKTGPYYVSFAASFFFPVYTPAQVCMCPVPFPIKNSLELQMKSSGVTFKEIPSFLFCPGKILSRKPFNAQNGQFATHDFKDIFEDSQTGSPLLTIILLNRWREK